MRKDIDRPAFSNIAHLYGKEKKQKVGIIYILYSLLSVTFSSSKGVKGGRTNVGQLLA